VAMVDFMALLELAELAVPAAPDMNGMNLTRTGTHGGIPVARCMQRPNINITLSPKAMVDRMVEMERGLRGIFNEANLDEMVT